MDLIKTRQQGNPPQIKCPKCDKTFYMHLKPWENDITKVMEDKCPKCGATLFVALLILAHPDLRGLMETIKGMVTAIDPNKILH